MLFFADLFCKVIHAESFRNGCAEVCQYVAAEIPAATVPH